MRDHVLCAFERAPPPTYFTAYAYAIVALAAVIMGSIAQMKGGVEPRNGVQGSRPPLTACHPSSIVEVDSVSKSGRNSAEYPALTVTAQYGGRRRRLVGFLQKFDAIAAAYQQPAG